MFNRKITAVLVVSAFILVSAVPVMAAGAAGVHVAGTKAAGMEHENADAVKEKKESAMDAGKDSNTERGSNVKIRTSEEAGKSGIGNEKHVSGGGDSGTDKTSISINNPDRKIPYKGTLSGNGLKKRPDKKERIQDRTSSENAREIPDISENRILHAGNSRKVY